MTEYGHSLPARRRERAAGGAVGLRDVARSAALLAGSRAGIGLGFVSQTRVLLREVRANGSAHPWLIPEGGFDEGVDLDSLMPAIQLVLAGSSVRLWWLGRSSAHGQERSPMRRLPSTS